MQHDLKPAVATGRFEVCQDIDDIAVPLVIVPVDPPGPVALSELEEECGEVIGQVSVFEAGSP